MVKNPPEMQEIGVPSLGWEDALEKGMATHSSILAWWIPWTEEPGKLQSMGSQKSQTWLTNARVTLLQQLLLDAFSVSGTENTKCSFSGECSQFNGEDLYLNMIGMEEIEENLCELWKQVAK